MALRALEEAGPALGLGDARVGGVDDGSLVLIGIYILAGFNGLALLITFTRRVLRGGPQETKPVAAQQLAGSGGPVAGSPLPPL